MQIINNYRIRAYRKDDEKGIIDLFATVFGKDLLPGQWQWKYLVPGNGRIFSQVVEDASGLIVGHAGAVPLRGIFRQQAIQFFQIADVMVHPKARGFFGNKNIFTLMIRALFENINREFPDVFCYGFPGNRPFLLGERVGVYEKIEQSVDCEIAARPPFFSICTAKKIEWNDHRLDLLWARNSRDCSLSLVRDERYLGWRYAANPFFTYQLLGIFFLNYLIGWAVIRELKDEILIVDLFSEKKRCRHVLSALRNLLAPRKIKIRIWLPESWRKMIDGCTEKKAEAVITNMTGKFPISTSLAREHIFYTMGDVDIY